MERNALSSTVRNILFRQWIARANPRHYLHSKVAVFCGVDRDLAGCMACYRNVKRLDSSWAPVVRWSHETGEVEDRAGTFAEFLERVAGDKYEYD